MTKENLTKVEEMAVNVGDKCLVSSREFQCGAQMWIMLRRYGWSLSSLKPQHQKMLSLHRIDLVWRDLGLLSGYQAKLFPATLVQCCKMCGVSDYLNLSNALHQRVIGGAHHFLGWRDGWLALSINYEDERQALEEIRQFQVWESEIDMLLQCNMISSAQADNCRTFLATKAWDADVSATAERNLANRVVCAASYSYVNSHLVVGSEMLIEAIESWVRHPLQSHFGVYG